MSERWKPSVTVAAIAAREVDGRPEFLLVEEETPEGPRLNNPAGHLDPGESPEQAVVREALEETARLFTPTALIGVYLSRFVRPKRGEDVTYLRIAYAGSVGAPDPRRALDDGIVRTVWMTVEEVRASRPRHRSALVLQGIQDWLAGRAFPLDVVRTDPSLYRPDVKDGSA